MSPNVQHHLTPTTMPASLLTLQHPPHMGPNGSNVALHNVFFYSLIKQQQLSLSLHSCSPSDGPSLHRSAQSWRQEGEMGRWWDGFNSQWLYKPVKKQARWEAAFLFALLFPV